MQKGSMIYEGRKKEAHEDGTKHWYHIFRRLNPMRDGAIRRHFLYIRPALLVLSLLALSTFSADALPSPGAPIVEATEPGAPTSLEARLQLLEYQLMKAAAVNKVPKAKAVVVPEEVDPAPPASKDEPVWKTLIYSPVAIMMLVMAAIFGIRLMNQRDAKAVEANADAKQLDADRWVGLVHHLYNAAENSGWMNGWSGKDKLAHAMDLFDSQYVKAFGYPPGEKDRTDLTHDLAILATNSASQPPLRGQAAMSMDNTEISAGLGETPKRGVANLIQKTGP